MNYTTKDISFIIPSYNTFNFTKMAYESIRRYYPKNEIVFMDDGSTDNSWEWLIEPLRITDPYVKMWRNFSGSILGHTVTYDMGIKMATNPLVTIFHSDMVCSQNYLENMLKHWKPKAVVCATRVEPEGIYPPGKEKILKPFGIEWNEFKQQEFDDFVAQEQVDRKDQTSRGMFAPWLINKEDFLALGGHDALHFAPYPEEDADLFLRWVLAGYELIQSRDALCWHWISRGHRSWATNGVGKDDQLFKFYQNRARRNYIRKWHKWMTFDEYHHPIPHKVFDIAFIVRDVSDVNFLHFIEPWTGVLYVDNIGVAGMYMRTEQQTTKIDLSRTIKAYPPEANVEYPASDVVLEFSQKDFMASANENAAIIMKLTDMLSEGIEDNSEFELGIFKLKTKTVKDVSQNLIKV